MEMESSASLEQKLYTTLSDINSCLSRLQREPNSIILQTELQRLYKEHDKLNYQIGEAKRRENPIKTRADLDRIMMQRNSMSDAELKDLLKYANPEVTEEFEDKSGIGQSAKALYGNIIFDDEKIKAYKDDYFGEYATKKENLYNTNKTYSAEEAGDYNWLAKQGIDFWKKAEGVIRNTTGEFWYDGKLALLNNDQRKIENVDEIVKLNKKDAEYQALLDKKERIQKDYFSQQEYDPFRASQFNEEMAAIDAKLAGFQDTEEEAALRDSDNYKLFHKLEEDKFSTIQAKQDYTSKTLLSLADEDIKADGMSLRDLEYRLADAELKNRSKLMGYSSAKQLWETIKLKWGQGSIGGWGGEMAPWIGLAQFGAPISIWGNIAFLGTGRFAQKFNAQLESDPSAAVDTLNTAIWSYISAGADIAGSHFLGGMYKGIAEKAMLREVNNISTGAVKEYKKALKQLGGNTASNRRIASEIAQNHIKMEAGKFNERVAKNLAKAGDSNFDRFINYLGHSEYVSANLAGIALKGLSEGNKLAHKVGYGVQDYTKAGAGLAFENVASNITGNLAQGKSLEDAINRDEIIDSAASGIVSGGGAHSLNTGVSYGIAMAKKSMAEPTKWDATDSKVIDDMINKNPSKISKTDIDDLNTIRQQAKTALAENQSRAKKDLAKAQKDMLNELGKNFNNGKQLKLGEIDIKTGLYSGFDTSTIDNTGLSQEDITKKEAVLERALTNINSRSKYDLVEARKNQENINKIDDFFDELKIKGSREEMETSLADESKSFTVDNIIKNKDARDAFLRGAETESLARKMALDAVGAKSEATLSTQQKEDFDKAMSLWYQEKNSDAKVEDFINTKDTNLKTKLDAKLRKYHIAPKYLDGMNEDQLRKLADDNFSDTKANRDYLKGTKLENIITDEVLKDYGKEETLDLGKNTAIEAIDKNAYTREEYKSNTLPTIVNEVKKSNDSMLNDKSLSQEQKDQQTLDKTKLDSLMSDADAFYKYQTNKDVDGLLKTLESKGTKVELSENEKDIFKDLVEGSSRALTDDFIKEHNQAVAGKSRTVKVKAGETKADALKRTQKKYEKAIKSGAIEVTEAKYSNRILVTRTDTKNNKKVDNALKSVKALTKLVTDNKELGNTSTRSKEISEGIAQAEKNLPDLSKNKRFQEFKKNFTSIDELLKDKSQTEQIAELQNLENILSGSIEAYTSTVEESLADAGINSYSLIQGYAIQPLLHRIDAKNLIQDQLKLQEEQQKEARITKDNFFKSEGANFKYLNNPKLTTDEVTRSCANVMRNLCLGITNPNGINIVSLFDRNGDTALNASTIATDGMFQINSATYDAIIPCITALDYTLKLESVKNSPTTIQTIQSYQNMLRSLKALVDAGITENGVSVKPITIQKLEGVESALKFEIDSKIDTASLESVYNGLIGFMGKVSTQDIARVRDSAKVNTQNDIPQLVYGKNINLPQSVSYDTYSDILKVVNKAMEDVAANEVGNTVLNQQALDATIASFGDLLLGFSTSSLPENQAAINTLVADIQTAFDKNPSNVKLGDLLKFLKTLANHNTFLEVGNRDSKIYTFTEVFEEFFPASNPLNQFRAITDLVVNSPSMLKALGMLPVNSTYKTNLANARTDEARARIIQSAILDRTSITTVNAEDANSYLGASHQGAAAFFEGFNKFANNLCSNASEATSSTIKSYILTSLASSDVMLSDTQSKYVFKQLLDNYIKSKTSSHTRTGLDAIIRSYVGNKSGSIISNSSRKLGSKSLFNHIVNIATPISQGESLATIAQDGVSTGTIKYSTVRDTTTGESYRVFHIFEQYQFTNSDTNTTSTKTRYYSYSEPELKKTLPSLYAEYARDVALQECQATFSRLNLDSTKDDGIALNEAIRKLNAISEYCHNFAHYDDLNTYDRFDYTSTEQLMKLGEYGVKEFIRKSFLNNKFFGVNVTSNGHVVSTVQDFISVVYEKTPQLKNFTEESKGSKLLNKILAQPDLLNNVMSQEDIKILQDFLFNSKTGLVNTLRIPNKESFPQDLVKVSGVRQGNVTFNPLQRVTYREGSNIVEQNGFYSSGKKGSIGCNFTAEELISNGINPHLVRSIEQAARKMAVAVDAKTFPSLIKAFSNPLANGKGISQGVMENIVRASIALADTLRNPLQDDTFLAGLPLALSSAFSKEGLQNMETFTTQLGEQVLSVIGSVRLPEGLERVEFTKEIGNLAMLSLVEMGAIDIGYIGLENGLVKQYPANATTTGAERSNKYKYVKFTDYSDVIIDEVNLSSYTDVSGKETSLFKDLFKPEYGEVDEPRGVDSAIAEQRDLANDFDINNSYALYTRNVTSYGRVSVNKDDINGIYQITMEYDQFKKLCIADTEYDALRDTNGNITIYIKEKLLEKPDGTSYSFDSIFECLSETFTLRTMDIAGFNQQYSPVFNEVKIDNVTVRLNEAMIRRALCAENLDSIVFYDHSDFPPETSAKTVEEANKKMRELIEDLRVDVGYEPVTTQGAFKQADEANFINDALTLFNTWNYIKAYPGRASLFANKGVLYTAINTVNNRMYYKGSVANFRESKILRAFFKVKHLDSLPIPNGAMTRVTPSTVNNVRDMLPREKVDILGFHDNYYKNTDVSPYHCLAVLEAFGLSHDKVTEEMGVVAATEIVSILQDKFEQELSKSKDYLRNKDIVNILNGLNGYEIAYQERGKDIESLKGKIPINGGTIQAVRSLFNSYLRLRSYSMKSNILPTTANHAETVKNWHLAVEIDGLANGTAIKMMRSEVYAIDTPMLSAAGTYASSIPGTNFFAGTDPNTIRDNYIVNRDNAIDLMTETIVDQWMKNQGYSTLAESIKLMCLAYASDKDLDLDNTREAVKAFVTRNYIKLHTLGVMYGEGLDSLHKLTISDFSKQVSKLLHSYRKEPTNADNRNRLYKVIKKAADLNGGTITLVDTSGLAITVNSEGTITGKKPVNFSNTYSLFDANTIKNFADFNIDLNIVENNTISTKIHDNVSDALFNGIKKAQDEISGFQKHLVNIVQDMNILVGEQLVKLLKEEGLSTDINQAIDLEKFNKIINKLYKEIDGTAITIGKSNAAINGLKRAKVGSENFRSLITSLVDFTTDNRVLFKTDMVTIGTDPLVSAMPPESIHTLDGGIIMRAAIALRDQGVAFTGIHDAGINSPEFAELFGIEMNKQTWEETSLGTINTMNGMISKYNYMLKFAEQNGLSFGKVRGDLEALKDYKSNWVISRLTLCNDMIAKINADPDTKISINQYQLLGYTSYDIDKVDLQNTKEELLAAFNDVDVSWLEKGVLDDFVTALVNATPNSLQKDDLGLSSILEYSSGNNPFENVRIKPSILEKCTTIKELRNALLEMCKPNERTYKIVQETINTYLKPRYNPLATFEDLSSAFMDRMITNNATIANPTSLADLAFNFFLEVKTSNLQNGTINQKDITQQISKVLANNSVILNDISIPQEYRLLLLKTAFQRDSGRIYTSEVRVIKNLIDSNSKDRANIAARRAFLHTSKVTNDLTLKKGQRLVLLNESKDFTQIRRALDAEAGSSSTRERALTDAEMFEQYANNLLERFKNQNCKVILSSREEGSTYIYMALSYLKNKYRAEMRDVDIALAPATTNFDTFAHRELKDLNRNEHYRESIIDLVKKANPNNANFQIEDMLVNSQNSYKDLDMFSHIIGTSFRAQDLVSGTNSYIDKNDNTYPYTYYDFDLRKVVTKRLDNYGMRQNNSNNIISYYRANHTETNVKLVSNTSSTSSSLALSPKVIMDDIRTSPISYSAVSPNTSQYTTESGEVINELSPAEIENELAKMRKKLSDNKANTSKVLSGKEYAGSMSDKYTDPNGLTVLTHTEDEVIQINMTTSGRLASRELDMLCSSYGDPVLHDLYEQARNIVKQRMSAYRAGSIDFNDLTANIIVKKSIYGVGTTTVAFMPQMDDLVDTKAIAAAITGTTSTTNDMAQKLTYNLDTLDSRGKSLSAIFKDEIASDQKALRDLRNVSFKSSRADSAEYVLTSELPVSVIKYLNRPVFSEPSANNISGRNTVLLKSMLSSMGLGDMVVNHVGTFYYTDGASIDETTVTSTSDRFTLTNLKGLTMEKTKQLGRTLAEKTRDILHRKKKEIIESESVQHYDLQENKDDYSEIDEVVKDFEEMDSRDIRNTINLMKAHSEQNGFDVSYMDWLGDLLTDVVDKGYKTLKLSKNFNGNPLKNFSYSKDDTIYANVSKSDRPFTSSTELLYHEALIHPVLLHIAKDATAHKRAFEVYNMVMSKLKPEHFPNKEEGIRILKYINKLKGIDSVGEFFAYATTNAQMRAAINNLNASDKVKESIFSRVKGLITRVLIGSPAALKQVTTQEVDTVFGSIYQSFAQAQANRLCYESKSLKDKISLVSKLDMGIYKHLEGFLGKTGSLFVQANAYKNASIFNKAIGVPVTTPTSEVVTNVLKDIANIEEDAAITKDGMSKVLGEAFNNLQGATKKNWDYIKLRLACKHGIDVVRNRQSLLVNNLVKEVLKGVPDNIKEKLTDFVIRTDISTLFNETKYSLKESLELVKSSKARKKAINELENKLMKNRYGKFYINASKGLADYLTKGINTSGLGYKNAIEIANLNGSSKRYKADNLTVSDIDTLVTLYAMENQNNVDDSIYKNIPDTTITELSKIHNFTKSKELEVAENNGTSPILIPKGFVTGGRAIGQMQVFDKSYEKALKWSSSLGTSIKDTKLDPFFSQRQARLLTVHYPFRSPVPIEGGIFGVADIFNGRVDKGIKADGRSIDVNEINPTTKNSVKNYLNTRIDNLNSNNPKFLDASQVDGTMVPLYNDQGNLTGATFELNPINTASSIGQYYHIENVLGDIYGNTVERQQTLEQNTNACKALTEIYEKNKNSKEFEWISPDHDNENIREAYINIPVQVKEFFKEKYGNAGIPVLKGNIVNVVGKRQTSSKVIDKEYYQIASTAEDLRNRMVHYFRNGWVSLGEEAFRYLAKIGKESIVIKSMSVGFNNYVSNYFMLINQGLSPLNALKYQIEGIQQVEELNSIQSKIDTITQKEITNGKLSQQDKQSLIALKNSLDALPIYPLFKNGILGTIIEDTSNTNDVVKGLVNKYIPSSFQAVAHELVGDQASKTYGVLREFVNIGDKIGKYALYKHMKETTRQSFDEIAQACQNTFIDYSIPLPTGLDYMESIGVANFMKYGFGIQRVLLDNAVKSPSSTFATYVASKSLSMMSGSFVANPLDSFLGFGTLNNGLQIPGFEIFFSGIKENPWTKLFAGI